ncbi:MAG TPA: SusC/RagA family TonB-linked outer membrane protein [Gemmatimonadaceae bacterium]|nr:SusC/RagA family TonB-linked outer membrane protein [Gemmatimonadaceae bacterium]
MTKLRRSRWPSVALALLLLPAGAMAQAPVTISGRVTSDAGAPLASASVLLEGMGLGTLTREDGRYTFTVPAARATGQQATLTARLIGYRQQSVPVTLQPGAQVTHDFALAANPLQLGEVVVTGAGTMTTREKLGNVINSVDAQQIEKSNETNVVSALAGKAPNVEIRTQSGEPGASAYIRIRGAKSINGTGQPLFVVDGVPIDNTTYATGPSTGSTVAPNRASDINPADIESVDILKGSAAAAIYGARAAEGVVLITTKSGKAGPTRYSLRSTYQTDKVTKTIPLNRKYGHGSRGVPALLSCGGLDCALTSASFGPELNEDAYVQAIMAADTTCNTACATALINDWYPNGIHSYDHAGEVFDHGYTWDNVMTVSGGNDRTTFYLSGGYMNQDGVIVGPNNAYDKTTVRLKASHRLLDRLTVGGNAAYFNTHGNFVQKGSNTSGLQLGAWRTPPDFNNRPYLDPQFGMHRSYRFPRPSSASREFTRIYDNPLFVAFANPANRSELGRFIGNVNAQWNALDWLQVNYTLGSDYYADWRLEGLPFTSSSYPTGLVTRADITNLSIDHNLTATASHTFSPRFTGTLTLGQNLNARRYRLANVTGYDLIAEEPFALQNTINWEPSETRSTIHTESYFGQATADLFDQLYLTAAIRNDGFSTFGASQRRHWFPKFSAAWTFTNALGMTEGRGPLSYGKIRAAYGETGKEPPVYATITAYEFASFGGGWGDYLNATQNGFGAVATGTQVGNNSLKPERTREVETGLDLGLFNQMADLSITYYDSKSSDVILSQPVSTAATGYYTSLTNAAVITNKGWEVALNVRPVTKENFAWDIGLQWAHNRNDVLDLLGAEFVDKSAGSFTGAYGAVTKGVGVGVLRGYDFARCGYTDPGFAVEGGTLGDACAGAPKGALYIGSDGLPVVDPTDRVIGNPNPNWTGSLRTGLTFLRRWQVSGLLDIKQGGDVWNGTKGALYNFGAHKDTERRNVEATYGKDYFADKYPDVVGPGAGTPFMLDQSWYSGQGGGFGDVSAQFVEDGSYVKLREISLTYTADQPWVRNRLGLSSMDFRIAGRNLKTWTDYTGLDPESNLGGAEVMVQGVDYFNNPQTRSFVFSIGLNR